MRGRTGLFLLFCISVFIGVNAEPAAYRLSTGNDVTLSPPENRVKLLATVQPAPQIASYVWRLEIGPASVGLYGKYTADLSVTLSTPGVYVFSCSVKIPGQPDLRDEVQVNFVAAPNPAGPAPGMSPSNPEIPAGKLILKTDPPAGGPGVSITMPNNMVRLGVEVEHSEELRSLEWRLETGPQKVRMAGKYTEEVTILVASAGQYNFSVTALDAAGRSAVAYIPVTVHPEYNVEPTAAAGEDVRLVLPQNRCRLAGRAADPDGRIVSYRWELLSGPSAATVAGPNSLVASVADLVPGEYVFRFTVTDERNGTASDTVRIVVDEAQAMGPGAADEEVSTVSRTRSASGGVVVEDNTGLPVALRLAAQHPLAAVGIFLGAFFVLVCIVLVAVCIASHRTTARAASPVALAAASSAARATAGPSRGGAGARESTVTYSAQSFNPYAQFDVEDPSGRKRFSAL